MEHFFHFFTPSGCGEHLIWPYIAGAAGVVGGVLRAAWRRLSGSSDA